MSDGVEMCVLLRQRPPRPTLTAALQPLPVEAFGPGQCQAQQILERIDPKQGRRDASRSAQVLTIPSQKIRGGAQAMRELLYHC